MLNTSALPAQNIINRPLVPPRDEHYMTDDELLRYYETGLRGKTYQEELREKLEKYNDRVKERTQFEKTYKTY